MVFSITCAVLKFVDHFFVQFSTFNQLICVDIMLDEVDIDTKDDDASSNDLHCIDSSLSLSINHGFQFWKNVLASSRYILAPMVDQSELAFRLFVRKYQVQCTYSPMFNANIFVKDVKYQRDCLQILPAVDKPLIIQVKR